MTWSWARATWAGWLPGIPAIVALALVGEALGLRGSQSLVGAGIGSGVGLMPARFVRRHDIRATAWFWGSVIGLAAPFVAFDLARLGNLSPRFSVYAAVALGGLAAGVWQARLLRPASAGYTRCWVLASLAGWTLAGGAAAVEDPLSRSHQGRGVGVALGYLGIVASGGLVLGLVTGVALARMAINDTRPA